MQPNGHCTAPAHYVPFELFGGVMTVHDTNVIEGLPVGMMKNDAPGAEDERTEDAEVDTDGEGPERRPKEFWSASRDGCPGELDFATMTLTERMDWGPACGGSWECRIDPVRNYEAPCPKYFQVEGESCVPLGDHSLFGNCPAEIPIFKTAEEKRNHEAECPDRQWPPLETQEPDCDHRAWDDPCPEGWTFQRLSNATTTTTVSLPVKATDTGETSVSILRGIAESILHHPLKVPNGPLVEVSTTTAVPGQPETWACLASAAYSGPCSPIQYHVHRLSREAKRAWVARCKAPYRCLDCPPSERLYEQPCPRYWRPSNTRTPSLLPHRLQQRTNLVPGAGAAYDNTESGPPSWVLTNHHQSGGEARRVVRKPKPKVHPPKSPTSVTCHPPHFYQGPCNALRGFPDHPAKRMAAEAHCEVSWPCVGRVPLPYRAPIRQASVQGAVHEMSGGVN
ncbi:MAG: uncharacterized protein KVP18_002344 [Porospora cf. gigantea A]|uniref:uncharacterized protein n=1 Tax=Porospora cf. gigantea A TaxID=2853593 RepID=UPI00355AAB89|nr:MAG: hypothetical protein KVP18_002344 [Porospora cf. gigantea A]